MINKISNNKNYTLLNSNSIQKNNTKNVSFLIHNSLKNDSVQFSAKSNISFKGKEELLKNYSDKEISFAKEKMNEIDNTWKKLLRNKKFNELTPVGLAKRDENIQPGIEKFSLIMKQLIKNEVVQ